MRTHGINMDTELRSRVHIYPDLKYLRSASLIVAQIESPS